MHDPVEKSLLRWELLAPVLLILISLGGSSLGGVSQSQSDKTSTATEREIEKQHQRLASSSEEDRRDALMRLGAMHLQAASRVCLTALADESPRVRATAAKAILALNPQDSYQALIPLLNDKDEFVRREAVYALGLTHSRSAVDALTQLLVNDKEDGVRGASAIALGEIADEGAVVALASVLSPMSPVQQKGKRKKKDEQNPFVLRAAARALGQIRSRVGVPALLTALEDEKLPDDVRREAAHALGLIGDPAAVPALRAASSAADPYLAQAAYESLRKLS